MGAMSRTKGATFEREVAKELFLLTGIAFTRNLTQWQTSGLDDLIPDDPAWPFAIECKRYKDGSGCAPAWRMQAARAAEQQQRLPAVIYRYDRQPVRVSVPFAAFAAVYGETLSASTEWAEISLQGLAFVAGEIMARQA